MFHGALSFFNLRITLSILVVIAGVLALQSILSPLKFRSLVAEAVSSRLQVVAGAVETLVHRGEGVGMSLKEMSGLAGLVLREKERGEQIQHILVVSPKGDIIVSAGGLQIPQKDRGAVMRRVLGSGEKITTVDRGELLYSGRLLFDSSNSVMGAVIVSSSAKHFMKDVSQTTSRLNWAYLSIFGLILVFLVPLVLMGFGKINQFYYSLTSESLRDGYAAQQGAVSGKISEGNEVYEGAWSELQKVASSAEKERGGV
ncbi:hypothetical protein [Flexibacterium corallicola]|uniref:hypothetical protein n=1 Tax=Flexibacterium corallicola TaxID=3037259 RepID=UPI00286F9AF7|nr:hypothetical protein [Pseudovibrio sp. M1P-2-3]